MNRVARQDTLDAPISDEVIHVLRAMGKDDEDIARIRARWIESFTQSMIILDNIMWEEE